MSDDLVIGGRTFASRLFVGTGKYRTMQEMADAIEASGTDMVTVAIRRVDFENPDNNILNFLNFEDYLFLPNTAGAKTAEEAIRIARMGREASQQDFVKLEVIPDPDYLLPCGPGTLAATEALVKEGFTVLPYMQPDPILARQLQDAGAAAVMPLGAPIGSNRGLQTRDSVAIIIEQANVPVVVDAGLGLPSHACQAMELGADAVLVNTAIAKAADPVAMAKGFAAAVTGGRLGYLAEGAAPQLKASPSSPTKGIVGA